jgi:hypothetical protein
MALLQAFLLAWAAITLLSLGVASYLVGSALVPAR